MYIPEFYGRVDLKFTVLDIGARSRRTFAMMIKKVIFK